MGGKALKHVATRRYGRDEYFTLWEQFSKAFAQRFPGVRFALVPACRAKKSFGDMDVVVVGDQMPDNWHEAVNELFDVRDASFTMNKASLAKVNEVGYTAEMLLNRPYSFNLEELQVDLCPVPTDEFDCTLTYMSYGDLGNLMGTVYRRLGARYGMQGLMIEPVTPAGERLVNHQVLLTRDHARALSVAGYDPERFARGFEDDDAVYRYVASSPFFSPAYYLEDSTDTHKKRRRLADRPAFARFQAWCEDMRSTFLPPLTLSPEEARLRLFALFPGAEQACRDVHSRLAEAQRQKKRFSGRLLQEETGVSGPELGKVAEFMKSEFSSTEAFQAWLEQQNDAQLRCWVRARYETYRRRAGSLNEYA